MMTLPLATITVLTALGAAVTGSPMLIAITCLLAIWTSLSVISWLMADPLMARPQRRSRRTVLR